MSGPTFDLETKGAQKKLAALAEALENKEPLFRSIGNTIRNRIQMTFKLGRSPAGESWLPLKLRDGEPLRDTGLMQRSITTKPDPDGVTIGTNKIQARVHQFGATIVPIKAKLLRWKTRQGRWFSAKKVVIPPRPFMPLDADGKPDLPQEWNDAVLRGIRAYMTKAAKDAG